MRCKKPQSVHSEDDHPTSTKSQSKMGAGAVTGMITRGQYSAIGEHARRLTPPALQCALLCGGANCRYERPQRWPPDQLALQGVYSHWITEDVLAMARPSTASIATWNIIQQFHSWGIRSVINLQAAGEHARCGPPLEASGFTYDPSVFMNNNIYYYNFAWRDYGCAGLRSLLDAVKVLSFAVGEGRVAVHCHAGLGRTGVLIACYLVRERRLRADDAIALVRERRSRAVQTKLQVEAVHHFERYLLPQTVLFSIKEPPRERNKQHEFGLMQHLHRQKATLHGQEERTFRFLPKIIYFLCERLLRSCSCEGTSYSGAGNVNYVGIFTSTFLSVLERQVRLPGDLVSRGQYCATCKAIEQEEEDELNRNKEGNILESIQGTSWAPLPPPPSLAGSFDDSKEGSREGSTAGSPDKKDFKVATAEQVAEALLLDYALLPEDWQRYLRQFQADLNSHSAAFTRINTEHDLRVIAALVLEWLEGLKMPILDAEDLATIVIWGDRPQECLLRLELEDAILVEYLVSVISRLDALPCATRCALVRRLSSALTQRPVRVRGVPLPSKSNNRPLRSGTAARLSGFLARLSTIIISREATCAKCDKRDVLPAIMPAKKSPSKQTKLSFTPRKQNILHNAIAAGQNEATL